MYLKKAVVFAAVFSMLCTTVPYAPFRTTTESPVICAYATEADTAVTAFLEKAVTDGKNYVIAGEGKDVSAIKMSGRTYGSGVQFSVGWYQESSITLDVKDCTALNFTVGHIDREAGSAATMTITLDGEKYESTELSETSELKEYKLPVKDVSEVTISFSSANSNGVYGIAGIQTDTADSAKDYTIPSYTSCKDIAPQVCSINHGTIYEAGGEKKLNRKLGPFFQTFSKGIKEPFARMVLFLYPQAKPS